MIDKQIIIDGVDVSGCEFRFRTYGCDCMSSNRETKVLTEGSRCADNPNCYYKQLKRKEQECEELKEKLIKWLGKEGLRQSEKEFYEQQLDQLKAENDLFRTCHDNEQAKRRKYEQAIEDIKEITEHCIKQDICTTCDNSDKCHIEDEEIPTYDVCKLILQKISECEVE